MKLPDSRVIGRLCCALALALLPSACIPSAPPAAPPPASPRPETGAGGGGIGLRFDAFDQSQVTVKVVKEPDGSGYTVSGIHGLQGKIRKNAQQPLWTFSATFTFPSTGYTLGEPYLSALGADIVDPTKDLLEFTGTVMITLPIRAPKSTDATAQVLQEVPVSMDIYANAEASFTVLLGVF